MGDTLATRLAALRATFLETAGPRLIEAENRIREADAESAAATRDVHRILHQLRGNAGMLGCRELEQALYPILCLSEEADSKGNGLRPNETKRIADGIAAAQEAALRDSSVPRPSAISGVSL